MWIAELAAHQHALLGLKPRGLSGAGERPPRQPTSLKCLHKARDSAQAVPHRTDAGVSAAPGYQRDHVLRSWRFAPTCRTRSPAVAVAATS